MMRLRCGALAVVLTLAPSILSPVGAREPAVVTIVDGDTIKHNGTTFRLWGIDAPENKQWCGDYPAGVQATATLEKLIKGKVVTCEKRDVDRYGRTVAVCFANGDDLGAAMVRLGMAWAFVRYSRDYVGQERQAATEGLGVHAHNCMPAFDWQAERR